MENKEAIKYLIKPVATSTKPSAEYLKQKEAYDLAVKALEKPQVTVFAENASKEEIEDFKQEQSLESISEVRKMRLFDLKIAGEESGGPLGGTAPYKVILREHCTVREFVEYVLNDRSNEWGYIGIHNPEKGPFFGYPNIQYSCGRLKAETEGDFREFLGEPVIKATASGGWSRMDYILYI